MKRKTERDVLSEGLGTYQWPSDLDDDALFQNRYRAFMDDYNERERVTAFEHAEELMDRTSTETDEEGIPWRNRIRRIVEDSLSVLTPNMPTADLRHEGSIDPGLPPEERNLLAEVYEETEKTRNRAATWIERRSDYANKRTRILYDAVVNGVGYAHPRPGDVPSIRRQPEATALAGKGRWDLSDWQTYERLGREPHTGYVDANEIVWRAGVRSVFDDDMLRVSRHRVLDVEWLRDYYSDAEIEPGDGYLYLTPDTNSYTQNDRAGMVETWQIEPFIKEQQEVFFMGAGDARDMQVSREVEDAIMTYTVFTTNRVLEKEVLTSEEVVMELPFIPYYVKISKDHPYGFSIPLMLELQQMFANRMRAIMVKQAMNSVSPGVLAILLSAITGYDKEQIDRALKVGGPVYLEGNDIQDVGQIAQMFPNMNQGVNASIAQVVADEERSMDKEGQAADVATLARSRSASGKHALLNATDRPKGFSVMLLAESEEQHKMRLDKLNQHAYPDEGEVIPVEGRSAAARVNQRERVGLPVQDYRGRPMRDPAFRTPLNPQGFIKYSREVVRNDMRLPMRAVASNRGHWPTGMFERFRLADAMAQSMVQMHPKTLREIVLDERTKLKDDKNWAESEQDQMQQQLAAMMQQAQQTQQGGGSGAPGSAAPAAPDGGVGQRRATPEQDRMQYQP